MSQLCFSAPKLTMSQEAVAMFAQDDANAGSRHTTAARGWLVRAVRESRILRRVVARECPLALYVQRVSLPTTPGVQTHRGGSQAASAGRSLRACFENHAGLLAKRRTMRRIMASCNRVSLVWTLRSSSLLKRRCRPIHPGVRSTIQHHGRTMTPWACGTHVMLSTCQAPSVTHQVANASPR
jgi:hypothetical protein